MAEGERAVRYERLSLRRASSSVVGAALRIAAGQLLLSRRNRGDLLWIALLFVTSSGDFWGWTLGENRACVVPGGGRHMRQPAIPKLSELSTAGRAELLANLRCKNN